MPSDQPDGPRESAIPVVPVAPTRRTCGLWQHVVAPRSRRVPVLSSSTTSSACRDTEKLFLVKHTSRARMWWKALDAQVRRSMHGRAAA